MSTYVPEYIGSSVQFSSIQFIKAGLALYGQLRNQNECMNTQSRITQITEKEEKQVHVNVSAECSAQ